MTKDLICGMEGNPKIIAMHRGKNYYFCSEFCKKTFAKNPKKYVR